MKSRYFLAVFVAVFAAASISCKSTKVVSEKIVKEKPDEKPMKFTTSTGLEYQITKLGVGELAADGDLVSVHYTGKLENGEVFDSSIDRGEPIEFKLGEGRVIKGWEEGIKLLNKGAKATLSIPSDLAYGEAGAGPIPPGATLIFDVELVDVKKPLRPLDISGFQSIQTASGLKYTVVESKSGEKIMAGMRVKVHYSGFFEDGRMFDSSYQRGTPIELVVGKGMVIPGWDESLQLLSVGDKAQVLIPYNLAYGEAGRGPIPGKSNLVFDMEIVDAVKVEEPKPFPIDGLPVQETETGLKYIIVEQGTGSKPQVGNLVVVHYSGYLEDGTLFDSSVQRGEPFSFRLGQGSVISGWDQGFVLLNKGSKARLILPSDLAYGSRSMGPIPANSTLIFDIQLIDIQP
jgi:peptidylprolyl isomerase